MKAQEVGVKSDLKIVLESDNQMLDEVMVVAYGTAKKSSFTGSASTINNEKLELRPITNLTYIIHSGFISGYQNRYGDNLKPPTNVYHRMTA